MERNRETQYFQYLAGGTGGKEPRQVWGLNTNQETILKGIVLKGFSLLILPLFSSFKYVVLNS